MILQDRFLTQLAPDIHCKLLKQAYAINQSLDNLLQLAQTVYYGREHEEKKEMQKKTKAQEEALIMAVRTVLKQPEKNAQRKRDGMAITVERRSTLSEIALRHLGCSWLHVWSVRDHTRGGIAPRGIGFRDLGFKKTRAEGAWGYPHELPS